MGNYIDSYFTKQIIGEGDFVVCKNCNEIATYRCCVSKAINDFDGGYHFMDEYLYTVISNDAITKKYHFVACSKCINEHEQIFTHYPNGWKESDKVHYTYEVANFDNSI
ncbi:hypothetical protein QLL95_gp0289 [Cotonvirus japonicus]|uniref:Uncharacterized protein n=1 Tax=Cotonvirus japonicus TaxID=2811091 RepID=A0ABM7NRI5_9VIRU|nr:hypothetical protein QLL95_gp0289 [Cotonvirus japonicus]BCS82778.1 hypothetical protein [Cotonvirus japonicus]